MFCLGLIGYPLSHSFSQRYFTEKFRREGIDDIYIPYPIETIEKLPQLLDGVPTLIGLNVTIPYKEQVLRYANRLADDVKVIGASNTLKIRRDADNKVTDIEAYNTDWIGFRDSIAPLVGAGKSHSALVLGTGGASKAVGYAFRKMGIPYQFVSRNAAGKRDTISYSDLTKQIMHRCDIIVNATPVGMYPHANESPAIPYEHISANHICYDLIYNPGVTQFMERSADRGATVKNGLEMLHNQAEAAWQIWAQLD